MTYIILELFPEPTVVTNMDGEVWKTDFENALGIANECQQGMVVPLYPPLLLDICNKFESNGNNTDDTNTTGLVEQ